MSKVDITKATVNILIELNGEVHLVAMEKDKFDAVSLLAKASADTLVKTGITQNELLKFLNYRK